EHHVAPWQATFPGAESCHLAHAQRIDVKGDRSLQGRDIQHHVSQARHHSSLSPASAITFFQRARSAFRKASNSAGELPTGLAPILVVNSTNGARWTARALAAASFALICVGIPAGASKPANAPASNCGRPAS